MKAIRVHEYGQPDVMRLESVLEMLANVSLRADRERHLPSSC